MAKVIAELSAAERVDSEPIRYDGPSGALTIRVRLMRANGNRTDQMLGEAVGWALGTTSPDPETRMKVLTWLRLSKAVLGIVAEPPLVEDTDERLGTLLDVAGEVEGLIFNGFGLRTVDGVDVAWQR